MIEKMTNSEKQVMDVLWSADQSLSCIEIVKLSEDKTWKDSYVHSLVKSLIKKGIVKVVAFELNSRSYARKFAPKISYHEYCLLSSYTAEELQNADEMTNCFATFLHYTRSPELTENIQRIITEL